MKRLSDKLTDELLDTGLANSTWKENHEQAYKDLLDYRQDIEQSFREILQKPVRRFLKEITG